MSEEWRAVWLLLKSEAVTLGVAGIAGAVAVSLVEWDGWVQLSRKVVVGGLCAVYMSPLAVPMLEFFLSGLSVDPEAAPSLSGFVMGMIGIVMVEFILHVIRLRKKTGLQDITPTVAPPYRSSPRHERGRTRGEVDNDFSLDEGDDGGDGGE